VFSFPVTNLTFVVNVQVLSQVADLSREVELLGGNSGNGGPASALHCMPPGGVDYQQYGGRGAGGYPTQLQSRPPLLSGDYRMHGPVGIYLSC